MGALTRAGGWVFCRIPAAAGGGVCCSWSKWDYIWVSRIPKSGVWGRRGPGGDVGREIDGRLSARGRPSGEVWQSGWVHNEVTIVELGREGMGGVAGKDGAPEAVRIRAWE